jgi:predicted ribosomally synthesized peptide with SipW-like signal peptide
MRNKCKKLGVAFVAVSMVLTLSGTGKSLAYFNDTATIEGTTFSMGTLVIDINPAEDFDSGIMYPNDTTEISLTASNVGSLSFQYFASSTFDGNYPQACDYIDFSASSPKVSFTDSIKNFSSPTSTLDIAGSEDWDYSFKIKGNAPPAVWGSTCSFKLTYTAWQENLVDSSSGFSSVKEKVTRINIGKMVVMNEILPNPEADDAIQQGLDGEWVEIYNNSNTVIDLTNWEIRDVSNNVVVISPTTTWNNRTIIGAKGSGLEWVVVFLNGDILDNGGDTVSFYSPTGDLVDQYSYGSSLDDSDSDSHKTPLGDNQNPAGSETEGNEGKSYARLPIDGLSGWVDPVPTPGRPNILSDSPEKEVSLKQKIDDQQEKELATEKQDQEDIGSGEIVEKVELGEDKKEKNEQEKQDEQEVSGNKLQDKSEEIAEEDEIVDEIGDAKDVNDNLDKADDSDKTDEVAKEPEEQPVEKDQEDGNENEQINADEISKGVDLEAGASELAENLQAKKEDTVLEIPSSSQTDEAVQEPPKAPVESPAPEPTITE